MKKLVVLVSVVALVTLAFFAVVKWIEDSSAKDRRARLSAILFEFQKEIDARGKAETMAKDKAAENERLREEIKSLETRLKDCEPSVPPTKRVVPREGKPRTWKKSCEKKVASKPKALALSPAPKEQEETLVQRLAKACGGMVKFDESRGKWHCVSAPPPTSSFAKAIDEEIGVQVAVPTSNVVAAQEPLQPRCSPYIDSDGMLVPEGDRRVPGGSRVLCN